MFNSFLLFALCFCSFTQLTVQIRTDDNANVTSSVQREFVTHVSRRSKRENRVVEFFVDGEKNVIPLTPIQNNVLLLTTSIWSAVTVDSHRTEYTKLHGVTFYLDGNFYENFNRKAVMYAVKRYNRMNYYGVYGEGGNKKVIQTLPEKLQLSRLTNYSDYIDYDDRAFLEARVTISNTNGVDISKISQYYKIIKKPSSIFYTKLLVVLDYNYYEKFYGKLQDLLQYISIFWNSVQLKYSEIEHPKVKIMITGIIIAEDANALNDILLKDTQDFKTINVNEFFAKGPINFRLFGQNKTFTNYDNVIVMSNYTAKMLNNVKSTGVASFGGVCSKNVTFVTDEGNFDGIAEAVNQLGYNIGINYNRKNQYEKLGTVMHENIPPAKSISWTQDDVDKLQLFGSIQESWCLDKTYRDL